MKIKLAKTELIHFVGIGGIGMSGLALIMKGKGFKVQGSDIANNKNIERLRKEKIKVFIGHKKQNIEKGTILVVSSAIKKNNPELLAAKKKQLPIYKRGEMLANIVSLTKNIVVVGSHGKTTTTSLIASIFQETKIDPTIINGGVINSINNSAKLGKSDWSILEADESDGSFVFIPPTYSIITNIDREHMDYYGTMDKLNKYFEIPTPKKPSWLKVKAEFNPNFHKVKEQVKSKQLYTVCEEAHCPNINECWSAGTATFMLMGSVCTRACKFCSVDTGNPNGWLDKDEPLNTAKAVEIMKLKYVVLTSVNRDDLPDGGAQHFANTVKLIKDLNPDTAVEALTPDFKGLSSKRINPKVLTKTSIILGLGETDSEIEQTLDDLAKNKVDIVTIGQYLRPRRNHHPIERWVTPEEFERYRQIGLNKGFLEVVSGPMVRSSYRAERALEKNNAGL